MYAFYCVRGYNLDYLANLSFYEKTFLRSAMIQYFKNREEEYEIIMGK